MHERKRLLETKFLLGIESKEEFKELKDLFEQDNQLQDITEILDLNASNEAIKERLMTSISQEKIRPVIKLRRLMAIAAAASILFILGYYTVINYYKPIVIPDEIVASIHPLKNEVSILIDGKQINIESEKSSALATKGISYQDGTLSFENTIDTTSSTIIVPNGKQYQFVLSDGTKVWLNSNSKITFPNQFHGNTRKVTLHGEGYFEVHHDDKKRFIVHTKNQKLEVLGTKFNINSYNHTPLTTTTLAEGAIKISSTSKQIIIKPNQQTSIDPAGNVSLKNVEADDYIDWIDGYFTFNNATVVDIMNQLGDWYNLDIIVNNYNKKNELFTGKISHSTNLSDILKILASADIQVNVVKKRGTTSYSLSN